MKNKMSGEISFFKFLFAIIILVFHTSMIVGLPYFTGGYIFVEWFYIFSGYTLANKVYSLKKDDGVAEHTLKITYSRIANIFPYYVISCIIALIFKILFKQIDFSSSYMYHRILHEVLLLQMFTVDIFPLTGTAWFLSSLVISLVIIIPILIRFKNAYMKVLSIIVAILLFYYIYKVSGYLYGPAEWLDLSYKGNLRAVAGISLGIFGYQLGLTFNKVIFNNRFISFIKYIAYIALLVYMYKVDDGIQYFIFPFIFMILITIQMNNTDSILFKDNGFTRFLGKISMVLFLNHYYVVLALNELDMSKNQKAILTIAISFAISIFIILLVEFIRYIFRLIKDNS